MSQDSRVQENRVIAKAGHGLIQAMELVNWKLMPLITLTNI